MSIALVQGAFLNLVIYQGVSMWPQDFPEPFRPLFKAMTGQRGPCTMICRASHAPHIFEA